MIAYLKDTYQFMSVTSVFISVLLHVSFAQGQTKCSRQYLEGVIVTKVKKTEMKSIRSNSILKTNGESYKKAIDFYEDVFFIPIDSLFGQISWHLTDSLRKMNEKLYILPSQESNMYISKFCDDFIIDADSREIVNSGRKEYFTLNDNHDYLYSFVYVKGEAVLLEVENSRYNKIYLKITKNIDSYTSIDCWFFLNIQTFKYENFDSKLKKWVYTE